MYLSEVLDMYGPILLDDYSGTKLGENDHLEVIGWAGRNRTHKRYVIHCTVCEKDTDLYGDGYFTNLKADLEIGKLPCGCAKSSRKNEAQLKVLVERALLGTDCKFLGWVGRFEGVKTRCTLYCTEHGEWESSRASQVIYNNIVGCPKCGHNRIADARRLPDYVMIDKFMRSEAFHERTSFERSSRLNKRGYSIYWDVTCDKCDTTYSSNYTNLIAGKVGCNCGTHNYKYCYINLIRDGNDFIAVKFGVSKDKRRRQKEQDRVSIYCIEPYGVWEFNSKQACKLAENECLSTLFCGVVSRQEVPDGWSETTYTYNLDKIIRIYETYGGVRLDE